MLFACAHLLCSSQAFILDWSGRRHALAAWKVDGSGYTHTCGPLFFSGSRAFPATFPSQARRENGRERERERKLVGAFARSLIRPVVAPRQQFPAESYPESCEFCLNQQAAIRSHSIPFLPLCLRAAKSSRFKCIKCGPAAGHLAILPTARPSAGLVFFNYPSNCL